MGSLFKNERFIKRSILKKRLLNFQKKMKNPFLLGDALNPKKIRHFLLP